MTVDTIEFVYLRSSRRSAAAARRSLRYTWTHLTLWVRGCVMCRLMRTEVMVSSHYTHLYFESKWLHWIQSNPKLQSLSPAEFLIVCMEHIIGIVWERATTSRAQFGRDLVHLSGQIRLQRNRAKWTCRHATVHQTLPSTRTKHRTQVGWAQLSPLSVFVRRTVG